MSVYYNLSIIDYMQQYQIDFLISRIKKKTDIIICEYPWCKCIAVDIHHIQNSFRGKRKHNIDGSDLIAVCREHHNKIHSANNYKTREYLLEVVKTILVWLSRLYDKLWVTSTYTDKDEK